MKPSTLISIGFLLTGAAIRPVLAETIALTHINIIDVRNQQILPDRTLVIKNDKIHQIMESGETPTGEEVVTLDMSDHYVSPGLIDVHVHHGTDPDGWDNEKDTRNRLRNLLVGGITSVRDMGGDARALSSLKRRAQIDEIPSPDIYYSVIIGGPKFFSDPRTIASAKGEQPGQVNWMRAVTDDSDLTSLLLQAKGTGATGIKIYARVPANLVEKLATQAKAIGLKVWSHAYIGPAKPGEITRAGVETISHAADFAAEVVDNFNDWRRNYQAIPETSKKKALDKTNFTQLMADLKRNGTILDSTLTVFNEHNDGSPRNAMLDKLGITYTQMAHKAGIPIATGTDAFSDDEVKLYQELDLMANQVGMTAMETLQAATYNGARVLGIENTHGSIEVGKVANLAIFSDNPAQNIQHIQSLVHVVKNGRFVYRGDNPALPFSQVRKGGGLLWMSGQIGNIPGTSSLISSSLEGQMKQAMMNVKQLLMSEQLTFSHVVKCTLMLADMNDWQAASEIYQSFLAPPLPARSAFAASGLALGARVELECIAAL